VSAGQVVGFAADRPRRGSLPAKELNAPLRAWRNFACSTALIAELGIVQPHATNDISASASMPGAPERDRHARDHSDGENPSATKPNCQ